MNSDLLHRWIASQFSTPLCFIFRPFSMLQTKPSFQFNIDRFLTKGIIKFRLFPPDPGLVSILWRIPTFGVHSENSGKSRNSWHFRDSVVSRCFPIFASWGFEMFRSFPTNVWLVRLYERKRLWKSRGSQTLKCANASNRKLVRKGRKIIIPM
jgi:hypothetical protein